MKKILITTDFSNQSKAAIRFAIQLAAQAHVHLTFFHAYKVLRPTQWNDKVFSSYENSQESLNQKKLAAFVKTIYRSQHITSVDFDCVVHHQHSSDHEIMNYAENNDYSMICISRKGKGSTSAVFGATISKLITKGNVPVLVVPENYRRTKISNICLASDLIGLDNELNIVSDLAKSLKARVDFLHFEVPLDQMMKSNANMIKQKLQEHDFHPHFQPMDYENTLIKNINKAINKFKPDLMVMFSRKRKSMLEKIFLSSMSAEYAYITNIPLLTFRKTDTA